MELVAIAVFVVVVAAVAIDTLARGRRREPTGDDGEIATEKIVIDLRERK